MAPFEYGYFIRLLHMLLPFLEFTLGFRFQNYKDQTQHRNWPLLNFETSCGHSILDHYGYEVPSFGYDSRIWGGENARKNEFPWVVRVDTTAIRRFCKKETTSCGGSVINDRYVLTAAHCCHKPRAIKIYYMVVLSNDNVDINDHVLKRVEKMTIHEKYNDQLRNDICLVRLQEPLMFSESIQPICLPVQPVWQNLDLTGIEMVAVGWGYTNEDPVEKPKYLQTVILPVVPIADCIKNVKGRKMKNKKPLVFNPHTQFCLGNRRKNTCRGDSGGPVMYQYENNEGVSRYFLTGLVSFGLPCNINKTDAPGIFVKVSHYIPWILDNIYE